MIAIYCNYDNDHNNNNVNNNDDDNDNKNKNHDCKEQRDTSPDDVRYLAIKRGDRG